MPLKHCQEEVALAEEGKVLIWQNLNEFNIMQIRNQMEADDKEKDLVAASDRQDTD